MVGGSLPGRWAQTKTEANTDERRKTYVCELAAGVSHFEHFSSSTSAGFYNLDLVQWMCDVIFRLLLLRSSFIFHIRIQMNNGCTLFRALNFILRHLLNSSSDYGIFMFGVISLIVVPNDVFICSALLVWFSRFSCQ